MWTIIEVATKKSFWSIASGFCFPLWQIMGITGGSDSKESACQCKRHRFDFWGGEILWNRKWHPISVLMPEKFHGRRSLVGYSPWGRNELGTTELLSKHTHTHTHLWQIIVSKSDNSVSCATHPSAMRSWPCLIKKKCLYLQSLNADKPWACFHQQNGTEVTWGCSKCRTSLAWFLSHLTFWKPTPM